MPQASWEKEKREANRSLKNSSYIRRKRTMSSSNNKHTRSTTHREQGDWPHTRTQSRRLRSTSRCPRNSFNSTCNTSNRLSPTSLPSNKQDRHSKHSHHNNNRIPGEDTSQRLVKARRTFSHQQTTAAITYTFHSTYTSTCTQQQQHIAQYIHFFIYSSRLKVSFDPVSRICYSFLFSFGIGTVMISLPLSHHLFLFPFPSHSHPSPSICIISNTTTHRHVRYQSSYRMVAKA